jgi:S1-C subfamily serine protease
VTNERPVGPGGLSPSWPPPEPDDAPYRHPDPVSAYEASEPELYYATTDYGYDQASEPDESWTTGPGHDPYAAPPPPGHRGGGSFWKGVGIAVLSALIGAVAAIVTMQWLDDEGGGGGDPSAVTVVERVETQILSPEESGTTASAVAQRVLPSIVTVEVRDSDVGTFVADGSGSGVVLSNQGLLVTNQHVVEGAEEVRVIFANGRTYDAEVVGEDPLTDLAVLRIEALGLTAVEIGSTEDMVIGDTAIAIGSPLGLEGGPSVTVGVLSAFDRRVRTSVDDELFGMLQTDAPITRGSSGGALVDDEGRLIGITTAIGVSDVGAEGLGFAIPVELVTRITDDLIEFGTARHAFLGITGSTWFEEGNDGATIPAGVAIASVIEQTAADQAGLEVGDVIRSVDGDNVTTMEQLVVKLRFFSVGDVVDVFIERGGTEQTIELTLLERPEGV